jgi:hypothetical protein
MLTDRPPRDPARLAAFRASDWCETLDLPPDDRLGTPALSIEAALRHGTSTAVRDACAAEASECDFAGHLGNRLSVKSNS